MDILNAEDQKQRDECLIALRRLVATLEANPNLKAPYLGCAVLPCESLEEMRELVRAYGGMWHKEKDDADFQIRQALSDVGSILLYASHEKVCKRVVTGKRTLPAEVIPARPETTLPEREEDIVEWICPDSVLGTAPAVREGESR